MTRKKKKFTTKNSKKNGDRKAVLKDKILQLLNNNSTKAYSVRQLAKELQIRGKKYKDDMLILLFELEEKGQIVTVRSKFMSGNKPNSHIGKIDFVNARTAFIVSDEFEKDPRVRIDDLKYALDGDKVEFILLGGSRTNPKAKVVNILERKRNTFVGRIEISQKYAFVIADNRKMHYDIFVQSSLIGKAVHNDKVIVEITEWPGRNRKPEGKIIKILGKAGENDAEIHSIMAEFDLPFEFEERLEKEAEEISESITKEDISKRRDFRKVTTFTIDPLDAKDFDDALSVKTLKNGNYEIGVHIADVSHYVQPGTNLDREAYNRATSVYLVDRTIPMLPEKLSNGLCSLRPNEDKLCFSAVFEVDEHANVKKEWFGRTVIHSDRRFTYEEAQEVIENKAGDYNEEILLLNRLAKLLQKDRFNQGAINFETTEVKFKLDENGKPLGVVTKERKDAHKLIEEFMLLANKQVATYIYNYKNKKNEFPFVYRSHDSPDPEKLASFSVFARKFGHQLSVDSDVSKSLNNLMGAIEDKPEKMCCKVWLSEVWRRQNTLQMGLVILDWHLLIILISPHLFDDIRM